MDYGNICLLELFLGGSLWYSDGISNVSLISSLNHQIKKVPLGEKSYPLQLSLTREGE